MYWRVALILLTLGLTAFFFYPHVPVRYREGRRDRPWTFLQRLREARLGWNPWKLFVWFLGLCYFCDFVLYALAIYKVGNWTAPTEAQAFEWFVFLSYLYTAEHFLTRLNEFRQRSTTWEDAEDRASSTTS